MTEAYLRLQQARQKASFATASDAARAFGWNENTYRSHENGERGLRPGVAARYARAFHVSPAWLLTGENIPNFSIDVNSTEPVRQFVSYGIAEVLDIGQMQALEYLIAAPQVQFFATLVSTDRLSPRFVPGDLLLSMKVELSQTDFGDERIVWNSSYKAIFAKLINIDEKVFWHGSDGNFYPFEKEHQQEAIFGIIKKGYYELKAMRGPSAG